MSLMTFVFALIIVLCTASTIMLNRLTVKLSKVEISQKELVAKELAATEDIEQFRQAYHDAVGVYNDALVRFPGPVIAEIFGFRVIPIGPDGGNIENSDI